MAAPAFSATVDLKALARADKRLAGYMGRPLQRRAQQAYLEGARLMVVPMRRNARRMFKGRNERVKPRTANTITARKNRLRPGEIAAVTVGPTSPLKFIVVRGTKPHTLEPNRPGKGKFVAIPIGNAPVGGVGPRMANVFRGASIHHPGSSPRPFVDQTYEALGEQARDYMATRSLAVSRSLFKAF